MLSKFFEFAKMKKLLLAFLLCLPSMAAAAECSLVSSTCFGINWETATIGDIDGIDINTRDKDSQTPLHWAVEYNNNPKIILALLNAGANVKTRNEDGWTPLHAAAFRNSNPEIISILLNAGADIKAQSKRGETPLHTAAFHNSNPEIISALLKAGADIKAQNNTDSEPLHWAAGFNSNPEIVSILLKAGANRKAKNKNGKTAYDLMKTNEKLKDTPIYWKLHDLSFD